jgi:hypothetical protein
MSSEVEREALVAHLVKAHSDLLHPSGEPLPDDAALEVAPIGLLRAVHEANHSPVFRPHAADDWLTRRQSRGDAGD